MRVKHILCPMVAENCYLAINDANKQCLIIDPGSGAERIYATVQAEGVSPVAILLTHGHFDHAGAAAEVASNYNIKVYAYEGEVQTLENPSLNLSADMFGNSAKYHADVLLKDGQESELAGLKFKCLFTPGHTPGGCCFYFPDEGIVFTGDTLFCGSVGRTDFPGGSMSQLVEGIRKQLLVLPEDTICYTGHDAATTIGDEKDYNPFL
ncbi:MAG: MBL fold metallo-hydrolase [Pseudobutyrivibrio sp.]|nr:MBL fold metallo-hydrolase [Pseudobutyrivibrio sp.]